MRLNIFILFLFLSLPVFATEYVYSGRVYYGAVADQADGHDTYSRMQAGLELGFDLDHENFRFSSRSETGFSFISGTSPIDVGCAGRLDFMISYYFPKIFEPFIFSLNEFDTIGSVNWLGYTGGGTRLHAPGYKGLNIYFDIALAFQYENFDRIFPEIGNNNYFFSYYLGCMVHYRLAEKVSFVSQFKLIPIYDFSNVRFLFEVGIEMDVVKKSIPFIKEQYGVIYNLTVGVDTFSFNRNKYNMTQFTFNSGFKFYF